MALQKAPDTPAVAPSLKIWRQRQGPSYLLSWLQSWLQYTAHVSKPACSVHFTRSL